MALASPGGPVVVELASWGGQNVTPPAQAWCRDKNPCIYKVSERFLGKIRDPQQAFLNIRWKCSEGIATSPTTIVHATEGQVLNLACKLGPTPLSAKLDPKVVDYYQSIIERHRSGQKIRLEEFDRIFGAPARSITESEDHMLGCQSGRYSGSDCAPDTFYSWGPSTKLDNLRTNTPDGHVWTQNLNPPRGAIFLTHSAIASYCYGRYPLRFKLRPQAHLSSATLNKGWRSSYSFMEWWIMNGQNSELESVSYGQPEHFDEMVTELKLRLSSSAWSRAPLYYTGSYDPSASHKTNIIRGCVPEVYKLDEQVLVENLVTFVEAVIEQRGWIHQQACPGHSRCAPTDHFATQWSTFFNPD